jgi:signal transduction histidine kinase
MERMSIGSNAVGVRPVAKRRSFRPAENPLVRAIGGAPLGVRTKLLVGFAGIAALLVLVGVLGLVALGRSNARVERLGTLQARAAEAKGLQTDVVQINRLLRQRIIFTPNAGQPLGRGANVNSNSFLVVDATIEQAVRTFFADATFLARSAPRLFKPVYRYYLAATSDAGKVLQRDETGKGLTAGPLVEHEIDLTDDLEPVIDGLATRTQAQTDALVAQNQRSFNDSRNLFIGVAGASVVLAMLLGFGLSWSLIAPLRRTEARLAEIAAGDFSGHVDVPNRDEIGALAANVNRMNDELGRLYQELETVSRHKSEFLANMSHELRTPLNAIIGFSEVLREQMFGELNEQQLGHVDEVLVAARHLLSVINDVLDLAKIEAGRIELDLAEVSVAEILRGGLSMHGERASRGGVALGLAVEPDDMTVEADERRVRQVVFNLLANAITFTPPEGRIDVSARLFDGIVEVAVADTGSGVEPEDLDRIFEEFEQAHGGAGSEGTGLGLPLSRKLIELHGGQLWVESTVGSGSTFRFTLPVEQEGAARWRTS